MVGVRGAETGLMGRIVPNTAACGETDLILILDPRGLCNFNVLSFQVNNRMVSQNIHFNFGEFLLAQSVVEL